jgi:hypothetical protein
MPLAWRMSGLPGGKAHLVLPPRAGPCLSLRRVGRCRSSFPAPSRWLQPSGRGPGRRALDGRGPPAGVPCDSEKRKGWCRSQCGPCVAVGVRVRAARRGARSTQEPYIKVRSRQRCSRVLFPAIIIFLCLNPPRLQPRISTFSLGCFRTPVSQIKFNPRPWSR